MMKDPPTLHAGKPRAEQGYVNPIEDADSHSALIPVPPGGGFSIWLPVPSEQFAVVTLGARGVAVNPGASYSTQQVNHIRVATSTLCDR